MRCKSGASAERQDDTNRQVGRQMKHLAASIAAWLLLGGSITSYAAPLENGNATKLGVVALGTAIEASGEASFAMGYKAHASKEGTTALGGGKRLPPQAHIPLP